MIDSPHVSAPTAAHLVNRATVTAGFLAAAIFVVDVSRPLDADVGSLYVIPLLVEP